MPPPPGVSSQTGQTSISGPKTHAHTISSALAEKQIDRQHDVSVRKSRKILTYQMKRAHKWCNVVSDVVIFVIHSFFLFRTEGFVIVEVDQACFLGFVNVVLRSNCKREKKCAGKSLEVDGRRRRRMQQVKNAHIIAFEYSDTFKGAFCVYVSS